MSFFIHVCVPVGWGWGWCHAWRIAQETWKRAVIYVSFYSNHMSKKEKKAHCRVISDSYQGLPWRSSQLSSCFSFSLRWSGSLQSFPAYRVQRGESGILASMWGIQENQVPVQDGLQSQENLCWIHRHPVLQRGQGEYSRKLFVRLFRRLFPVAHVCPLCLHRWTWIPTPEITRKTTCRMWHAPAST